MLSRHRRRSSPEIFFKLIRHDLARDILSPKASHRLVWIFFRSEISDTNLPKQVGI